MNEVNKYILSLYSQLSENESLPIDDLVVDDAISVINNLTETDSKSLFYLLSAVNLLNAVIKVKKNDSQIYYGLIKSKVSKIADNVLKTPNAFNGTSIFYDTNQKCIYFDVYGVVFSFHQIQETKLIKTIASTNNKIIWPGIRLQRIAQSVYLYGKEYYEKNYNVKEDVNSNKVISEDEISSESRLIKCPDCSYLISNSAAFCPKCGYVQKQEDEIMKDVSIGDTISVIYDNTECQGQVREFGKQYIGIATDDSLWFRIKYTEIKSVKLLDTVNPYAHNELAHDSFIQQIRSNLERIFDIEGISHKSLILTNATITQGGTGPFMVITDKGEAITCTKQGCVCSGNRKTFLKDDIIGKRVYCSIISPDGICRCSIVEMSYGSLLRIIEKGVTKKGTKARTILFAAIAYLKYSLNKPEAFVELKKFEQNAEFFFGKFNVVINDIDNVNDISDATLSPLGSIKEVSPKAMSNIFKTETENQLENEGMPKIKIVGKIDLDKIPGIKKVKQDDSTIEEQNIIDIEKPSIITSKSTIDFLNKRLTQLSDSRCKIIEKELDTLIRNGKKEECLTKSYQIINTSRPTPKYFKSYLDRIVNTEIALDHTESAIQTLAYLIAFMEQQGEISTSSMGHLYVTMARLYLKEKNKEEAFKAIQCAESLKPINKAIIKLKESILQLELNADSTNTPNKEQDKKIVSNNADGTISKMIIQDVEQEAHRLELLPSSEIVAAEQLFGRAQNNRDNNSETYEDRASLFLESAAAYYNNRQVDTIMFKISVANYARLRGHGMFARFSNLIENNELNMQELQMFRDSACSYYIEALGIFNNLGENNYLRELLLRYLQLSYVISQIKGEKTPEQDWGNIPLGKLQEICLKGDSSENLNILLDTYLAIGSTAESAWVSLINDKGGIGPFRGKCDSEEKFRVLAFSTLNLINKSDIKESLSLEDFMHEIFEVRQKRIGDFQETCKDCLKWEFSTFDISSFESKLVDVVNYKDLMTTTDQIVVDNIEKIIEILRPYAGRKENERTRLLVRSQQILLSLQKIVTDTATFYGKTFFSHLVSEWLTEISRLLEERDASTYPKLEITPEPCFIRNNEEGLGTIDFVVTNNGDSTAQSFFVVLTINGKKYKINHDKELPAGDCCGKSLSSEDFLNMKYCNVVFELTAKYQEKELPIIITEATYEVESGDVLTDEIEIPWTISNTPEEHIFKGREEVLNVLVNHYLSKGRSLTYILYGLTRTGKSSILEYLRCRINGRSLKENPNYKINSFKWNLNECPYKNSTSSQFWTWALETNIYNELNDELADKIDMSYGENGLPPAEQLSQLDFTKIVDVLNKNNIIPLITIDEFSFVRHMLKVGLIDATFIATLRNLALTGKACFIYAGTYEIKDLPKEKEFGLEGQMTNTRAMHINEIAPLYADELIDACELITFDDKAKAYIRALSGCVPYWIQWICLDCAKYAVSHKRRHLGYNEVNHVVGVLTGEMQPRKNDTCVAIDEANFHNNQIDPENIAEHQLISSISYLNRESTQIERGISMDELKRLWDKYSVNDQIRVDMTKALISLKEKNILHSFTDEGREVYRLNVDLFRRWWFAHHKDISVELSKKI